MPTTAATKAFALLAKRGAGKSYTGAVMAEEFAKAGIPFVVFDPIDVWWGLRLNKDGKSKGLPIVVFGLEHADIKLDRGMGKRIARAVVDENISCVISTFGMPKVAQRELIADFAEELLNINNTPRHIFIEEAHEFVPQRVFGAMGRCFAAVEALLVMGRNRGIGVTLINQRAATINKDLLTQVDTLLAFRNVAPQDRKALKEWVEAHSADGDFEAFMKSLPHLPTGEGWCWSPEFLETFEKIKIRKRETFHPDREKLGMTFKMPEIKQGDIQSFIDKFKTPQVKLPKDFGIVKSAKGVEQRAYVDPKPLIDKAVALERAMCEKQFAKERAEMQRENNGLRKVIEQIGRLVAGVSEKKIVGSRGDTHDIRPVRVTSESGEVQNIEVKMGVCERKIYTFLATNPDRYFSKVQVAVVTGYSHTPGGFNNALSKLVTMGLIERIGAQLKASGIDASIMLSGSAEVYNKELWLQKLGKCPREIYNFLLENPKSIWTKDIIAETLGYSVTSGGFNNALSQLSSLGLLVRKGNGVILNQDLLEI